METKTEIKIPEYFFLAKEYKWRDKFGNFHRVDDMETRHLFHVVRMIWDHSMPKNWHTRFRNRYRFPDFYTEDYMALSVRLMLPVVLRRQDLTPEMMYWLSFMESCLRDNRQNIGFVKKIAYQRES